MTLKKVNKFNNFWMAKIREFDNFCIILLLLNTINYFYSLFFFQAYLKYIEDHYPGLPRNLISTLHASEDDAIKLHGPHICSREDMNMKITKNLLIPESFGMKLDQDEKEFIGRLLSFDRFKIQVYLLRARPVQDKIYQVLRKCEKRVHYGKIPSTTGTKAMKSSPLLKPV